MPCLPMRRYLLRRHAADVAIRQRFFTRRHMIIDAAAAAAARSDRRHALCCYDVAMRHTRVASAAFSLRKADAAVC